MHLIQRYLKVPVICFSVSTLSRLFVCVRVWREAERKEDSVTAMQVSVCFDQMHASHPTQSCFFGVYACLLTCVFDRLHVREMVNLKGHYLRASESPEG